MTTYGAYDMGLVCKNPHCKSYGKPHPNCQCYGEGLAKGGEVEPFCGKAREHEPGCQYFQGGGKAEIPQGEVVPDNAAPTEGIPQEEVVPDLTPSAAPQEDDIPQNEVTPDPKHDSLGDMAMTAGENFAQGMAGPFATGAELGLSKLGVPGLSAEDQNAREEANPGVALTGKMAGIGTSLIADVGLPSMLSYAGGELGNAVTASKYGANIIKSMLSNTLLATGDEVSKYALGQGDANDAAASSLLHIGAAGLFGLAGGLAAGTAGKAAQFLAKSNIGPRAESFLAGLATAADPSGVISQNAMVEGGKDALSSTATDYLAGPFKAGARFFSNTIPRMLEGAGAAIGIAKAGGNNGFFTPIAEGILAGKAASIASKIVGKNLVAPVVAKMLQSDTFDGFAQALSHVENIAKGSGALDKGMEALIQGTTLSGTSAMDKFFNPHLSKKLDDYISNGGINQNLQSQIYQDAATPSAPEFAKGGEVAMPEPEKATPILSEDQGVALHYPDHNIVLNAMKGRVSNYLSSLKPQSDGPKLPFDEPMDHSEQERTYKQALSVANGPLGVLKKIEDGTIEPNHIKHLNMMYPELTSLMQKKATEQITKAQLKGITPPYHVRQGLSMLVGTALSGEMTPQNIAAAQSVFQSQARQGPQTQPPKKPKGAKSNLSKSAQAFLTGPQALESRGQRTE